MEYYKCPKCNNLFTVSSTVDKDDTPLIVTCRRKPKPYKIRNRRIISCDTQMDYLGKGFLGWFRAIYRG